MLYIIGIGLNDYKDISLRSFEILKRCNKIYQEGYTCIQNSNIKDLEQLIGKEIIFADRKLVEETDNIVTEAMSIDVAFLVVGTPFFATTHADIYWRALKRNIETKVIHNISILNVKGCYGLYSYNFGKTVSIPYFTENVNPTSFYKNIYDNYSAGLHTLCLLDIKTYEDRYMSVNEAIHQLDYSEEIHNLGIFNNKTKIFAICRFATDDEFVAYDTPDNLKIMDFGRPLHSLIIPAKLSFIEEEYVGYFFNKQNN